MHGELFVLLQILAAGRRKRRKFTFVPVGESWKCTKLSSREFLVFLFLCALWFSKIMFLFSKGMTIFIFFQKSEHPLKSLLVIFQTFTIFPFSSYLLLDILIGHKNSHCLFIAHTTTTTYHMANVMAEGSLCGKDWRLWARKLPT